MKKFKELMEKAGDTAVFTFGRFNPPTTGHEKLIEAVAKQQSKNAGSKMYVYASQSNDPNKNPLPYAKKIAYMRKMFKKYSKNIVTGKPRTAIEVAVELYNKGHRAIVMVVGSDRVTEFETLLNEYNGVEGKRHGYYGFDNIEVISAGERDPDAEGVEGMSASKMRDAAADGDFKSFEMGLPTGFAQRKELYRDVRKGMGMREERDMGEMTDMESLRDLYLTGKIWNAGDIIEAKGVTGSIIRKGTNYVSFADDDGKVHKCWIHEIQLNEGFLDKVKAVKDFAKNKILDIKKALSTEKAETKKMLSIYKNRKNASKAELKYANDQFKDVLKGLGLVTFTAIPVPGGGLLLAALTTVVKKKFNINILPSAFYKEVELDEAMGSMRPETGSKNIIITKLAIDMSRQGMSDAEVLKQMKLLRKKKLPELNKLAKELQMRLSKKEEVELDERNYAKEYANYQGTPEQIARRSSRNKARRVMGDKTKIGMDVGHKDNNPLNNDPTNLRNEDPSKNRREPRLREKRDAGYPDDSVKIGKKHYIIYKDRRDWYGYEVDKDGNQLGDSVFDPSKKELVKILVRESIDEAWYKDVLAKLRQIDHPRDYGKMVKNYAVGMKDPEHRKHPSAWAQKVAMEYRNATGRDLIKYINTLVDKGELPKELKAEYEIQSFKSFVETLNKNADQGDYVDDFVDSDAPQFKGKSKKKRVSMAVAAYKSKNEDDNGS